MVEWVALVGSVFQFLLGLAAGFAGEGRLLLWISVFVPSLVTSKLYCLQPRADGSSDLRLRFGKQGGCPVALVGPF